MWDSASFAGLEQWQDAANDAKECIRLDPSFIKGYYRLAAAQVELKDHDGAIATIRQGLSVEENNPQLSKQLRIVQQQKKVAHAKSAQVLPSGLAGSALDPATAKELQELRIQYAQTSREYQTVQANIVKGQREYKVADLTCQELQTVPDEANCYRGIGKMFLKSSKVGVVNHLTEQMGREQKNETVLTKKMEYLERQMTSLRQNIEELVAPDAESSAR